MFTVFEIASLCIIAVLCVLCTKTDMIDGLIYNRIIGKFSLLALFFDFIYYGFLEKSSRVPFLLNFLVVCIVSLYFFYSNSFAGGDCKMLIVLAMLYPAKFYFRYAGSSITLIFAIGFAIFWGYVYLVVRSLLCIATKRTSLTIGYVQSYFLTFIKSFVSATIYVALVNSLVFIIERSFSIYLNPWIPRSVCIITAWLVGKYSLFKRKKIFIFTVALLVITSAYAGIFPVSLNPENYTIVFVLLFCQMSVQPTIYENISVDRLKKGMILSTFSSTLMQASITKGLPNISSENLSNRLTEDEITSIRIWSKATHTESLTIVKKIPFAIFISIGFACYFVLWSISI